ncbi:2-hydroxyacyl-CoA dehydratase [Tindallia californiensis]|uniref:Predicted nucleotide-binding protein, sugar kinase/HSP70/actin superfamily n=1 Tax=Tindallia californiensis TaxID=159292 RepID=A0A1H3Q613_9FIRM|nr:2-hydroxyacyl-CoA dehydratase [Tindallia californiensis]SDZ08621.1 Predicted nucleotide-binding protein, sugar kinase/HSP70/actin superfamily [Tindallia californiensis]
MSNHKQRISFPHVGNYWVPLKYLFTEGMGVDYVVPPAITKKTLDIGSQHSPDFVCTPFKYNLGNYIETIEAGANTLVQTGGVCRLGYYGELHEQILSDLGYEVQFVNTARASFPRPVTMYHLFKEVNPEMTIKQIGKAIPVFLKMIEYTDELEDYIRKNIGFEVTEGSLQQVYQHFLLGLQQVKDKRQLKALFTSCKKELLQVELNLPATTFRVGIVGEYYTIMEPFSNHFIEKELAKMGIVVDRWMNITNSIIRPPEKEVRKRIKPYVKYNMGATSMYTVHKALDFAKKRYDGIIHVKSFGCTPEMDAIPVLQNISEDYKIPVLYFSFDTQTSDTGIQTRLEAFYDMIVMRNEAKV